MKKLMKIAGLVLAALLLITFTFIILSNSMKALKESATTNTDIIEAGTSPTPSVQEAESTPKAGSEEESDDNTAYEDDSAKETPDVKNDDGEKEPDLPDATPEPDMDPDTWDYVIENGNCNMIYTDKDATPKKMPYKIRVNKQMNTVTVYKADKKGNYTKPVKAFVCSAGRKTPLGTFTTSDKYYWKAMIHKVWAQYATRITRDILFHSVPYKTHSKDALITNYYNQLGQTASAGCVRLCVSDAKWIIENCPAGTQVEIYNDKNPGPLGKPSPIRVKADCKWDPTDPDERNPWNMKKTAILGVTNKTLERCQPFDPLKGITAYDKKLKSITTAGIKVKGKVDVNVPGKYKLTYRFKTADKKTISKKRIVTVIDTQAPTITGVTPDYYVEDAKKVTKEIIYEKIKLTDNGEALDKETHLTVTMTGNVATIVAVDDYKNEISMKVTVHEDKLPPVIKLKDNLKAIYPISYKIDNKTALKRIESVTDDAAVFKPSDVTISIRPQGWGLYISYSLTDHAGHKTSVSETVNYEGIDLSLTQTDITVDNIDSDKKLASYLNVKSNVTGKKIKYSLKISRKKIGSEDGYKIYNVTYSVTCKSSAGAKTEKITAKVRVARDNDKKTDDNISEKSTAEPVADKPENKPSEKPTETPTEKPTSAPTDKPTEMPTELPSQEPSQLPGNDQAAVTN